MIDLSDLDKMCADPVYIRDLDFCGSDYIIHAQEIKQCLSEGFSEITLSDMELRHFLMEKNNDGHIIAVADLWGKVIGTATGIIERKLIHNGGLVMHIEDVCVLNKVRGQGIGKKLMEFLVDRAKELGCYKVILDCSRDNYEQFYSKLGFFEHEVNLRINL